MKTKTKFCLIAFCALLSSAAFAQEIAFEKLYLESGNIQITPQGMFLDLNGEFLRINSVNQDEKGIFVTALPGQVNVITCKRCGNEYDSDNQSSRCPHGWLVYHPK